LACEADNPTNERISAFGESLLSGRIDAFGKAVKFKPDYGDAWHHLGLAHLFNRHPKDAVAALEEAVKCKPRDALCWRDLSRAYQMSGQDDKARAAFQQAIKINPSQIRENDPYRETREWMYR
jgi:Flp pilus assembly protein TadD